MKTRILPVLTLFAALHLGASASFAQQGYVPPPADDPQSEDGMSLIERGIGSLLDNFMADVAPDLNALSEDMSGALSRMAPVLEDLSTVVDDIKNYQTPERLENGDILIRRRTDAPPPPALGEHLRDLGKPEQSEPDHDMRPLRDPAVPEFEL